MIRGLTRIYQQASPRRPLRVQTDQGKEFYNRGVQAWFKKQGTHHFSTYGDSKASVVERWHRTLKQRMYRYFTAHNTLRYVDVLQPLIHTYNHAYHRSIGLAPHQVTFRNESEVWDQFGVFGGGHGGLRYCGIGLFFMRYFGNFNFNVRYCGIIQLCGMRFFIILADGIR